MDPRKIYFSDKQIQHQVNNIFQILKLPMDEDYYALCVKIVKINNAQLYNTYINKRPSNISLKEFLKKLNMKSTLDSAKTLYDQISKQNYSANNSSNGFASINDIGKNPFGEYIQQGFHTSRMIPQIQNRMDDRSDGTDFQQRLSMMQKERDQLLNNQITPQQMNGINPWLIDCPENRLAIQRRQQQMNQQTVNGMNSPMQNMNPGIGNGQINEPMIQMNNQSMNNNTGGNITGGFIATDIFTNNGGGGTDLNSAFSNNNMITNEEMQKYMNNNGPINVGVLQQQRAQEIGNIPQNKQQQIQQFIATGQQPQMQPQNYAQMIGQGNFKQVGVNDSSTLINKNQLTQQMMNNRIQINSINQRTNPQINQQQPIFFTCNSEQLISPGKPKNMFTIRSNKNELINIKTIKITNFDGIHNIPNINNENNKINLFINENEIIKDIKTDNYQISDLLDLLNNELDNVLFEFLPDDSYKISVKYLDSDITSDKINTFTINNTQNSIFRVLGFTKDTYSGKTEYISEEPVNLSRIPPFYLYMLINNEKMYKFNIRELNKVYKKEFKESINIIHTITFMVKQDNNQMYDLQNYISFNIEFD